MSPPFPLPTIHQKIFNFLQVEFLFQLISVNFTSCRLPQAIFLHNFIHFSIRKRQVQKPYLSWISFHLCGMLITFGGYMKKIGNAYGVIKVFKESMLLRILIKYWGRRECILKVVMLIHTKFTQQDTKNFSITNRLGRVFFLFTQKKLEHPSQVYRISHLLPSNPPSIVVTKVSLHQMKIIHL